MGIWRLCAACLVLGVRPFREGVLLRHCLHRCRARGRRIEWMTWWMADGERLVLNRNERPCA
jgi:hypothetical protein